MKRNTTEDIKLIERMNAHPELKQRFEEILSIADDRIEGCRTIDDAEEEVTQKLRNLGRETLEGWAQSKQEKYSREIKEKEPSLRMKEKKRA